MKRHWREKRQCLSPAFFFVLEKAAKSAGNAVIPTFPAHCPHGLQHLRHKRPTFAFTSESGHTLGSRRKIAHNGSHGETGRLPPPATAWSCAASEIATERIAGESGCTPMACVRFLRRRGPAGLRNLFFDYSVAIFAPLPVCQQLEFSIKAIRRPNVHCKTECILLQYSEKPLEWRRYMICHLSLFAMTSRK